MCTLRMKHGAALVLWAFVMGGCSPGGQGGSGRSKTVAPAKADTSVGRRDVGAHAEPASRPVPRRVGEPVSVERLRKVADRVNRFGRRLYRVVSKEKGNLLFSPWSLESALAMTYLGARGETAQEMARVLSLPSGDVARQFGALGHALVQGRHAGTQVLVANGLFPQKGYPFLEDYLQNLRTYFHAGWMPQDYEKNPRAAARAINGWVKRETKGRIPKLLSEDLSSDLRLVLVNALYFKGNWAHPFPKQSTRKGRFYVDGVTPVDVDTMHDTFKMGYSGHDDYDYDVVELPYAGSRLSMVLVVPRERSSLAVVERIFGREGVSRLLAGLRVREVTLSLPKFRVGWTRRMNDDLKALGMEQAFGPKADFSGMTRRKPGLYIQFVIHRAECEVDERGTVASATTAVGLPTKAVRRPIVVRVDRPFLFFIRHRDTGALLFLGRVTDPRTSG